jgi:hypothetical protein
MKIDCHVRRARFANRSGLTARKSQVFSKLPLAGESGEVSYREPRFWGNSAPGFDDARRVIRKSLLGIRNLALTCIRQMDAIAASGVASSEFNLLTKYVSG